MSLHVDRTSALTRPVTRRAVLGSVDRRRGSDMPRHTEAETEVTVCPAVAHRLAASLRSSPVARRESGSRSVPSSLQEVRTSCSPIVTASEPRSQPRNSTRERRPGAGSSLRRPLDVRDGSAVPGLVGEVAARHGRVDLMFNNAGIVIGGRTDEMTIEHCDRVIDVNLKGVINGSAPHIR